MKVLVTIESIEVSRKYTRDDGSIQNIHRVIVDAGAGQLIAAETFRTKDAMEKAGIKPGAVGHADLEFSVRRGTSKTSGEPYCIQQITLRNFDLANRNLANSTATPAAPAADPAPEAQEAQEAQGPTDGMF